MTGDPPESGGAMGAGLGLLDSILWRTEDGPCQGHTVHMLF